eukprot:SAG31_NODE_398_length_16250_cov_8.737601_11_plen_201_part_00
MLLALGLGGALGAMLALPPVLGLSLAYGLMLLSQSQGELIIRTLHNATAATDAAAPSANSDVTADKAFHEICAGYEAHHYDPDSNALHAAGMILTFGMFAALLVRKQAVRLAAWVPPTWYLFAWVGHYFYQADVPAVFTYGMTLRGWASGEACAVVALIAGRSIDDMRGMALTAAIMTIWLGCATCGSWSGMSSMGKKID